MGREKEILDKLAALEFFITLWIMIKMIFRFRDKRTSDRRDVEEGEAKFVKFASNP